MKKCTLNLIDDIAKLSIAPIPFSKKEESLKALISAADVSIKEGVFFYAMGWEANGEIIKNEYLVEGSLLSTNLKEGIEALGIDVDSNIEAMTSRKFSTFEEMVKSFESEEAVAETLDVATFDGTFGDDAFSAFTSFDTDIFADEEVAAEVTTSVKVKETIDDSSSDLARKKVNLLELTNGVADSSSDNWASFLSVYFKGMSSIGIEFVNFVQDKVLDRLADFSKEGNGFVVDVNVIMNEIRNEIYAEKIAKKAVARYNEADADGNIPDDLKAQLLLSDALKSRYFHDVFYNEFDFVLKNIIKVVVRSHKKPDNTDGYGESAEVFFEALDDGIRINLDAMAEAVKGSSPIIENEYVDGAFDAVADFETVKSDTADFLNRVDVLPNTVYHVVNDDAYYIMNIDGDMVDISPIPSYVVNTKNNASKGWSGDNDTANTLDQGTAFINNIISLVKGVDTTTITTDDGTRQVYTYTKERLTMEDFHEIAPHMGQIEPDVKSLKARLQKIAEKGNRKHAYIANSLLAHMFNDKSMTVDGKEIFSLLSRHDKRNDAIANAFASALISKMQEKYLESKDGRTKATVTATLTKSEYILDDSLVLFLTNKGYTNDSIASKIHIRYNVITLLNSPINKAKKELPTGNDGSKKLKDIDTIEEAQRFMKGLGLGRLAADIYKFVNDTEQEGKDVERKFLKIFSDIIEIAAYNIKTTGRSNKGNVKYTKSLGDKDISEVKHNDYANVKPTDVMSADNIAYILPMFSPEIMGSVVVGGNKRSATSLPNRNGSMNIQLDKYKLAAKKAGVEQRFNPFMDNAVIPGAEIKGYFIKTPMTKGGETLKVSEWGVGKRLEFEMLSGFIQMPAREKMLGSRFATQPLGYADKSNPQLVEMQLDDFNIFSMEEGTEEKMRAIYIDYFAQKNEDMQRIIIRDLKLFIGGDFKMLEAAIRKEGGEDVEARVDALKELRAHLMDTDFSNAKGDMSRLINEKLEIIKLNKKLVMYSESKLEVKADLITLSGGDHIYIKPHLGVRAAAFRNNGEKILDEAIEKYKALLIKENVDSKLIKKEYSDAKSRAGGKKSGLMAATDEIFVRMFIAGTVYGHAAKVMTMGDESAFPGKYNKNHKSIHAYYADIDSGVTTGKEEVDGMIKAQNKRGQSNTTNGTRYLQSDTYIGLKEEAADNNAVKYVEIIEDDADPDSDDLELELIYTFPKFEGKTLGELAALGILVKKNGSYFTYSEDGSDYSFTMNVGNREITVNKDTINGVFNGTVEIEDSSFVMALAESIMSAYNRSINTNRYDNPASTGKIAEYSSVEVSTVRLEPSVLSDMFTENEEDTHIVMPDMIPSLLVTDPVSYTNLINHMNFNQDNSDGVQYMHPLLHLIMDYARGKEFGAFHTNNYEALKTLTTSFNYNRFRQQLQKKSNQIPFSFEQMRELGGVELWESFKSMNTAVPFKQPWMEVGEDGYDRFENLHELYTHFLKKGNHTSETDIWEQILDVLMKYPVNLNSFVGYVTFETVQKNGNYAYNDFDDVFNQNNTNKKKFNLYNTKHEYNYELLSKAHEYDVTGGSALALLTQLVGSISAGGNSEDASFNIQNSMAALADIHRHALAKDFSNIARELQAISLSPELFNSIIEGFDSGKLTTKGLNSEQIVLFNSVIREGITQIAEMAFNENADSRLIEQVIKDSGLSLDSPAVQKRVLSTLRSSLFKQTVKIRHSGFQAVVSTPHKTAKIFNFRGGRVSRGVFMRTNLRARKQEDGAVLATFVGGDKEGIININRFITPLDLVKVTSHTGTEVLEAFRVDLNDPSLTISYIITPDVNPDIDGPYKTMDELNAQNPSTMVDIDFNGKKNVAYIWHMKENYSESAIESMIAAGMIKPYVQEKYSLRWYQYKNSEGSSIEEMSAFKNLHRLMRNKRTTKKQVMEAKAVLYQILTERDDNGDPIWEVIPPEIILPAYMASAFGLSKDGVIINDIIGFSLDTEKQIASAVRYFRKNLKFTKKAGAFRRVNEDINFDALMGRFSSAFLRDGSDYVINILGIIKNIAIDVDGERVVTAQHISKINSILEDASAKYVIDKAKSFVKAIDVNASRTPGQSMQSGFNAHVVAFLNAQGNSSMASTSHLVTTGGDFDIDLLNILTASIMKDGIILDSSRFYDNGVFNRNRMLKEFTDKMNASNEEVSSYIKTVNSIIDERIALIESYDMNEDDKAIEIEKVEKKRIDAEKEKSIRRRFNTSIIKRYDHYLLNAVRDSIQSAFGNVDAAIEINTAMSFTIMNALVDLAGKLKKSEEEADLGDIKKIDFNVYDGESFYFGLLAEEEALQGKDGIAVYATTIKMIGTIHGAKVIWDKKYSKMIGDAEIEGNITDIHDVKTGEKATILLYQMDDKKPLSHLTKEGVLNIFSYKKDTGGPIPLQINADYPKVMIVGDDFMQDEKSIQQLVEETKKDGVTDVLVIKGYEKDGEMKNIIVPIFNKSITSVKRKRLKIDPFNFTHTVKYKLRGKDQVHSRTTFADLDENALRNNLKNGDLGKIVTSAQEVELSEDDRIVLKAAIKDVVGKIEAHGGKNKLSAVNDTLGINIKKTDRYLRDVVMDMVEGNDKALLDIYYYMLGKDSTVDTQSQFMSSAVDNAKELILSKIRANSFTNAIVTTMMVLGYDPKVIVEFLHDPQMSKVIEALKKRRSDFESIFLSKSLFSTMKGVSVSSDYIKSILSLLEVSAEIHNLRSVKGLNENFKPEQFEMDRIRKNISYNKLYDAVIDDDISKVPLATSKSSPGKHILNPEMIIFLHTQSAALFVNVFEVENTILPAVSHIVKYLYEFSGGRHTEDVYRRLNSYISEGQVMMFLKAGIDGQPYTGKIFLDNGNKMDVNLDSNGGREKFVAGFKDYFLTSIENIKSLSGGTDNKLFSYMSSVNPINSDFSIINMPILNKSQPDMVELGTVKEAIEELKIETGDELLDAANLELYRNLMMYSLIVNAGKIQKNSMVELFPEISLDLSRYLNTLKKKDYAKLKISSKEVFDIVRGTLKDRKDTVKYLRKKNSGNNTSFDDFFDDAAQQFLIEGVDDVDSYEGTVDEGDDIVLTPEEQAAADKAEANRIKKEAMKKKKESPNALLVNSIYSVDGQPVIGVNTSYPSFRIVPSGPNEALPISFVSDVSKISTISEGILSDLALAKHTIGLTTSFGTNGRVLAFNGTREIRKKTVETYMILDDGMLYDVPGNLIMDMDEDIFLSGNVIERINARNIVARGKKDKIIIRWNELKLLDNSIRAISVKGFTVNKSLVDVGIDTATAMLMETEEKADIMMLDADNMAVLSYEGFKMNGAYKEFISSDKVEKAKFNTNSLSSIKSKKTSFLVPTIMGKVEKKRISKDAKKDRNKMFGNILGVMNSMKEGDEISLIGSEGVGLIANREDFRMGGSAIIKNFFQKYFKATGLEVGIHSFPGFILEISDMLPESVDLSGLSYRIIKTSNDMQFVTRYNGEDITIRTYIDAKGSVGLRNAKDYSETFKLGLLNDGIVTNIKYKVSNFPREFKEAGLTNAVAVLEMYGKKYIKTFEKVMQDGKEVKKIQYYSVIARDIKVARMNKKSISIPNDVNDELDNIIAKNTFTNNKYC